MYVLTVKGNVLFNLANFGEAIKCYDKALAIKHNYTLAQSNKDILIKKSSKYI
jgi:tetratricopeptide (TPR) repeat protein